MNRRGFRSILVYQTDFRKNFLYSFHPRFQCHSILTEKSKSALFTFWGCWYLLGWIYRVPKTLILCFDVLVRSHVASEGQGLLSVCHVSHLCAIVSQCNVCANVCARFPTWCQCVCAICVSMPGSPFPLPSQLRNLTSQCVSLRDSSKGD